MKSSVRNLCCSSVTRPAAHTGQGSPHDVLTSLTTASSRQPSSGLTWLSWNGLVHVGSSPAPEASSTAASSGMESVCAEPDDAEQRADDIGHITSFGRLALRGQDEICFVESWEDVISQPRWTDDQLRPEPRHLLVWVGQHDPRASSPALGGSRCDIRLTCVCPLALREAISRHDERSVRCRGPRELLAADGALGRSGSESGRLVPGWWLRVRAR